MTTCGCSGRWMIRRVMASDTRRSMVRENQPSVALMQLRYNAVSAAPASAAPSTDTAKHPAGRLGWRQRPQALDPVAGGEAGRPPARRDARAGRRRRAAPRPRGRGRAGPGGGGSGRPAGSSGRVSAERRARGPRAARRAAGRGAPATTGCAPAAPRGRAGRGDQVHRGNVWRPSQRSWRCSSGRPAIVRNGAAAPGAPAAGRKITASWTGGVMGRPPPVRGSSWRARL